MSLEPIWRLSVAAALVVAASGECRAAVIVAGELLVDVRASDLDASSTTWSNHSASADSVGDFTTVGGGVLNVAADVSDGSLTATKALYVRSVGGNAVYSALQAPASVLGNEGRSVEAWVFSQGLGGTQTVVSWGNRSREELSSFNYSGGGNGMVSGYFNDVGWDVDPEEPTGKWVHLAWTWDGLDARGYIDGALAKEADLHDFSTTASLLSIGATEETNGRDPLNGYIADVRVHTGVLSGDDVANNYREGFSTGVPEPSAALLGLILCGTLYGWKRV